MSNKAKFVIGAGMSAAASYIWTLIPVSNTFAISNASMASNTMAYHPLAFIEHYHWGLASMIVAKRVKKAKPYKQYLYGFGGGMVVIEAFSPQPFAIGKPPEQFYPSIALGAILTTALLL